MRLSRYFLPVLKETPAEAQIVSHRYMLRAGMIKQASAGIYSWLPLGFKVLRKLENIVHEEQVRAGHIPMLMPTLQSADLWRESGRYDGYGEEMLRMQDRHGRDMLFSPTAEEMFTDVFRSHVKSYKDLPLTLYQIQWKFRDEIRPRFGVMRGREFYMKDGYNFDLTKEDALHAYNRHLVTYLRTYERMGLQAIPMRADGGPIGGDYTHEFLVLAETGESEVFYDSEITDLSFGAREIDYDSVEQCQAVLEEFTSRYARTDETHDEALFEQVPEERRHQRIHAGHNCWVIPEEEQFVNADTISASCLVGTRDQLIQQLQSLDEAGLEVEQHARRYRSAEFRVLDRHEINELARSGQAEAFHREHASCLCQRLDLEDARHDRRTGEMSLEEIFVEADRLHCMDTLVRDEFGHAVDE